MTLGSTFKTQLSNKQVTYPTDCADEQDGGDSKEKKKKKKNTGARWGTV